LRTSTYPFGNVL